MRRRLPAVFLAALLTFAVSACGDDADDSDPSADDTTTSQTDDTTEDADPAETDDPADDPETDTDDRDDNRDRDGRKDDRNDRDGADEDDSEGDDNGAIPDDLESDDPDDPDELPIDAQVVYDTCDDVDPRDDWPAIGSVTFDGGQRNVVATADVKVKGGQTLTIVCDILGPENNPQVMAYNQL